MARGEELGRGGAPGAGGAVTSPPPQGPQAQAYTKRPDSEALPTLGITGRIPKRNGKLRLVSILRKRWVFRYVSAILMVGHHPILFPISPPKRKAKRHPSMNLLFPITDHRGTRFIRQMPGRYHSFSAKGELKYPHSPVTRGCGGYGTPRPSPFFPLHSLPSLCLHLSPGMSVFFLSSFYFLSPS